MDFELADEQLQLQRMVRELAEKECPATLVRAVVEGHDTADDLWATLSGLELAGLTVPADAGGQGATAVELVITLEELGFAGDPTPFLATTSQYVPVVRECTTGEVRRQLLGAVCAGGTGAASLDAAQVHARVDGGDWVLDGTARMVLDGDRADALAIAAATPEGPGVFVVNAGDVEAERATTFDRTMHLAGVRLDGVRVPPDRAAVGAETAAALDRATDEALCGLAASTVGACRRILDLVLEHVKGRRQFGVPIGSFQAVKHMVVDMYVAIERARALTQFAALTIAEDDPRRAMAASMAKAGAGDAQRIAVGHGVQLFGGLGFTWENDLQLFVRRAKVGELLLGGSHEHRARVARAAIADHLTERAEAAR